MRTHSHIVIGAGALGTAAAYWLARSGCDDVLVLEQFELGNERGASEDHSRIIRHSYHSADYTALTPAAYAAWGELEDETGVQLVIRTGGLDLAVVDTPGIQEIDNYRDSLCAAGLPWDDLDAVDIRSRYPQWRIDDDVVGMYQEDTGILDIRRACAAQIARAREMGVQFRPHTAVTGLRSADDHVTVSAGDQELAAEHVIVCVASWLPRLAACLDLGWEIALTEEQVTYFATPHVRAFTPERFPVWIWHGDDLFYGLPVYGEVAVKVARDMRGAWTTLDERSYATDPAEEQYLQRFLEQRLPDAVGPVLRSKACVYDMPPDRGFVIDLVPGHPRVALGIGAGHAAKFASLIGRILAELTVTGSTRHPIAPFALDRPALTDPSFVPTFRLHGAAAASPSG
ncbi:MAG: N-methyl-L-tryptophan oxidase [Solirubrobacterales bacterium]|nr:N-methyl-L-tryptophan oxidase [Solirubrobacterales bacterium]